MPHCLGSSGSSGAEGYLNFLFLAGGCAGSWALWVTRWRGCAGGTPVFGYLEESRTSGRSQDPLSQLYLHPVIFFLIFWTAKGSPCQPRIPVCSTTCSQSWWNHIPSLMESHPLIGVLPSCRNNSSNISKERIAQTSLEWKFLPIDSIRTDQGCLLEVSVNFSGSLQASKTLPTKGI